MNSGPPQNVVPPYKGSRPSPGHPRRSAYLSRSAAAEKSHSVVLVQDRKVGGRSEIRLSVEDVASLISQLLSFQREESTTGASARGTVFISVQDPGPDSRDVRRAAAATGLAPAEWQVPLHVLGWPGLGASAKLLMVYLWNVANRCAGPAEFRVKDLDLLVGPGESRKALQELAEEGLICRGKLPSGSVFVRDPRAAFRELQQRLTQSMKRLAARPPAKSKQLAADISAGLAAPLGLELAEEEQQRFLNIAHTSGDPPGEDETE